MAQLSCDGCGSVNTYPSLKRQCSSIVVGSLVALVAMARCRQQIDRRNQASPWSTTYWAAHATAVSWLWMTPSS